MTKHHRFMLQLHLQQIDALDAAIARIDQEVDANVDPIHQHLAAIRPDGSQSPVSGTYLVEGFLAFQLNEAVPRPIRAMFEVARGTMCYGYFFYPLYTLGAEQLYRVAETGIRLRCGARKSAKLVNLINQLIATGGGA